MRVPSSLAINTAAAELTNHRKHDSLRHPRRRPRIYHSLLSLTDGGVGQKKLKQAQAKSKDKEESKE